MKFEMVEETFGSKLQPYSNKPKTDVECILARIEELKSNAYERHVVFVGESHDNKYDKDRRAELISEIVAHGQKHFPNGPPKLVAERFPDVALHDVHMKEPNLADNLPKAFTTLRKRNTHEDDRATGVLTSNEKELKISGPASQSRNQWFAYAIMQTIQDTWSKPVPIVVVCGDDHAPFVSAALSDLAKSGYQSSAEVVWHHFRSAPDTKQPMNQVQACFNFDLNGKTPVGFIKGRMTDSHLLLLAEGNLPFAFNVELVTPYVFEGQGWALFINNDLRAAALRKLVALKGQYPCRVAADNPSRALKLDSERDITQDWHDVFGDLM